MPDPHSRTHIARRIPKSSLPFELLILFSVDAVTSRRRIGGSATQSRREDDGVTTNDATARRSRRQAVLLHSIYLGLADGQVGRTVSLPGLDRKSSTSFQVAPDNLRSTRLKSPLPRALSGCTSPWSSLGRGRVGALLGGACACQIFFFFKNRFETFWGKNGRFLFFRLHA